MATVTNSGKIDEILNRGVANIIPNREALKKALLSGKKLNVYLGIDPTLTQIHLGHVVPLRKLQTLVELGHHVTFLIGDFTALIGDSSDKDSERPLLTEEEIRENFKTYKEQTAKVLNFNLIKVVYNSEWLAKLNLREAIRLCQHLSLGDFISRELIRKRLDSGVHVRLDETLYPVLQGYDSYFMDTDLQIGGTDQTFNMQTGRTLQKDLRGKESFVLATTFLEGTDGRKMSKSWGNAIWLDDSPDEMYGKVLSLKDSLIPQYLLLATSLSTTEVVEKEKRLKSGENPMTVKKELAYQIVKELHNEAAAKRAQENFEKVFQHGSAPEEIPTFSKSKEQDGLLAILTDAKAVASRAEAKRLIEQGGVEVDGQIVTDAKYQIVGKKEAVIKIGKRRFLKVTTRK